MITTCILYASRYGSTRDIAHALARILGPARASPLEGFIPEECTCEFVVIGTPIYGEAPDPGSFVSLRVTCRGWPSARSHCSHPALRQTAGGAAAQPCPV